MQLNNYIQLGGGRPETDWEAALREAPLSMKELADYDTRHERLKQCMGTALEHLEWEEECFIAESLEEVTLSIEEILSEWPDDPQREVEIAMAWANHNDRCFGHRQWAADIRERLDRAYINALRCSAGLSCH